MARMLRATTLNLRDTDADFLERNCRSTQIGPSHHRRFGCARRCVSGIPAAFRIKPDRASKYHFLINREDSIVIFRSSPAGTINLELPPVFYFRRPTSIRTHEPAITRASRVIRVNSSKRLDVSSGYSLVAECAVLSGTTLVLIDESVHHPSFIFAQRTLAFAGLTVQRIHCPAGDAITRSIDLNCWAIRYSVEIDLNCFRSGRGRFRSFGLSKIRTIGGIRTHGRFGRRKRRICLVLEICPTHVSSRYLCAKQHWCS